MNADQIIVLIGGVGLIIFIYWFFLGKKERGMMAENNEIDIVVSGGYSPEHITVVKGQPTVISFTRTDPSSCLEEVVLADFNIRQFLPLNKKVSISISPKKIGKYSISCGMNMFHGSIEVVENV